jgi:Uma2 family endonuclease
MLDKTQIALTLDDLMRWEAQNPDQWIEIVNGEVAAVMAANWLHNLIIGNLYSMFNPFVTAHHLGSVHGDGLTYILKMSGDKVETARLPDFSFVRMGQLPSIENAEQPIMGGPALAVEIISPSQTTPDLLKRMPDYFDAGTEEFWVLYPAEKEVHRYHQKSPPRIYHLGETFTADTLFPGFVIVVADIFKQPAR